MRCKVMRASSGVELALGASRPDGPSATAD
jgi:hypothetical protein